MAPSIRGSLSEADATLGNKLAEALQVDAKLTLYHVSSPPTPCPAIFSAPPNSKPDRTYCESHFFSVAIESLQDLKKLLVFAIEILIYTTANLTTLFVSKADSTGFFHLLELRRCSTSPLKTISSTIISYLVENRRRPGIKLVASLFARAQDQYLFPGSIENQRKHVLSDRGLVKWWCQVLDPVIRNKPATISQGNHPDGGIVTEETTIAQGQGTIAQGYVIVPGCDRYETSSLFPISVKADKPDERKWINSHPLREICSDPNAPLRCLIPHFPDDPKARFLNELDDEIPETSASQNDASPSKRRKTGHWRSVKTLEQFWEMMAFRQECSSGRLVGFIWAVFTAEKLRVRAHDAFLTSSQSSTTLSVSTEENDRDSISTPSSSQPSQMLSKTPHSTQGFARKFTPAMTEAMLPDKQYRILRPKNTDPTSSLSCSASQTSRSIEPRKLRGPIIPRQPRVKAVQRPKSLMQPVHSKYYAWPTASRGQIVLDASDYRRVIDLLLRLDFSDEEAAHNSTSRWVDEAGVAAGITRAWGETIFGKKELIEDEHNGSASTNLLNTGIIRRKRNNDMADGNRLGEQQERVGTVLAATVVRKKPKATR